ncbi:MAG TPA: YdcF family protein [Stellaceae bacterium]|jgi:uncharacterized SAM-binding protein YcdF (DUF218 family)|nr:YdcF family protein [Stellaceae bacterium]
MELSYSALMPPMCLLLTTLAGVIIAFRWRRTGLALALISSLLLYACCTRFISQRLMAGVESQVPPPSPAALAEAQAIAVLSGDAYHGKPGTAPDDVGLVTLGRLRLAAALYRAHPLPILVTGSATDHNAESTAALMAETLEHDYGIKARWIEGRAENTYQNAVYSAAILTADNITRVIVVTDAWHLPRAIWSFAHAGMNAIPAPAERTYVPDRIEWSDFTPDHSSFERSFFALHELLGLAIYRLRYGPVKAAD